MPQLPITISGNLIEEPTCFPFSTGSTLTRLRVATSRRVRAENPNENGAHEWVDTDMLYIDVECWGSLAVNCSASLAKGLPVVVVGRLVSDKWTDGEGNTRYKHIIKANQVALELSRHQVSWKASVVQQRTLDGEKDVEVKTREDMVMQYGEVEASTSGDGAPAPHSAPHSASQPETPGGDDARFDSSRDSESIAVG